MSGDAITITRTLDAPLALVWRVWTEPGHFEQWFGAAPGTVSLDVTPGGAWSATAMTPAGEAVLGGVYREVVRHERLAWTLDLPHATIEMTATFAELPGGRTEVTLRQPVASEAESAQAEAGAAHLLDAFEKVVASAA